MNAVIRSNLGELFDNFNKNIFKEIWNRLFWQIFYIWYFEIVDFIKIFLDSKKLINRNTKLKLFKNILNTETFYLKILKFFFSFFFHFFFAITLKFWILKKINTKSQLLKNKRIIPILFSCSNFKLIKIFFRKIWNYLFFTNILFQEFWNSWF